MSELNLKEIQELFQTRVLELTQRTIANEANEEKFFAFPCGGGWLSSELNQTAFTPLNQQIKRGDL